MRVTTLEKTVKLWSLEDGFCVEIGQEGKYYEAWIYHHDYAVKQFMIGVPVDSIDDSEFEDIVAAEYEYYKQMYKQEVIQTE